MNELLDESWKTIHSIIIYGFGKSGQANINMFMQEFEIPYIIDNNIDYKGTMYYNIPIITLEDYLIMQKPSDKIVVIASGNAYLSIKESLKKIGKQECIDYIGMDKFVNEWYWRFHQKVCIGRVTISVTTKCTLNCQYCNMLMPYFRNENVFSINSLCRDADLLFSLVDYVSSYTIVGGEPFLYKKLSEYLCYIGENYRHKIGNLQLITNGTILPDKKILDIIRKWDVEVRISDYTNIVPYEDKLDKFIEILKKNTIKYVVFAQEEWLDFGLPEENIDMGSTREELRSHMLTCNSMCHLVHNGYYYYCSRAWCVEEAKLFELDDDDKINLETLSGEANGKEELLNFHIGNLKKGYMSYCKVCRGYKTDKRIKAGEQIRKNYKENYV